MNLLGDCKRRKFFIMMGNEISGVQLWTLLGLVLWFQEGSTCPQPKMMHAGVLLLLKDLSYLINLPSGETPCLPLTTLKCSEWNPALTKLCLCFSQTSGGWISLFQNEGHCFRSHCLAECRQCKCSGKSENNWCSSLFGGQVWVEPTKDSWASLVA